ncbi:MAG: hypothetical protein Q8M67_01365 [Bacteroidota bacterium]|nr:hypothetical protein [Bacteroidota bacterium]
MHGIQHNGAEIKRDINRLLLINYLFLSVKSYVFGYQAGEMDYTEAEN